MKHKLPQHIPLISFYSEASISPGVVAKMTHIAHAQLPSLPLTGIGTRESDVCDQTGHQVPVVIPASAAMAVCALHLQLRYGEKSDGLVTCRDHLLLEQTGNFTMHGWSTLQTREILRNLMLVKCVRLY